MSKILWTLFNKSLSSIFLELWKLCTVISIFKGGDRCQISNYRPISKQNIMPKIFKNIITDQLSSSLKKCSCYSWFYDGSIHLYFFYQDYINTAIEKNLQVDAIYTDFKKVSDKCQTILHSSIPSFFRNMTGHFS